MANVPLDLVTGFLGSGKTTLVNALLRNPSFRHTMVVVNEFGAVGLDHLLVTGSQDKVVLLDSGCLCCAVSGTLRDTLLDLFAGVNSGRVPAFDRLIVETSGLADPAPLVAGLIGDSALENRCRLNQVVTLVDAVNVRENAARYPEVRRQIALADRLLVTKLGAPGAATFAQVEALLAQLGAQAPTVPHARDDDVVQHFAPPRPAPLAHSIGQERRGVLGRGPVRPQYGGGALHGPGRASTASRTWRVREAIDWSTYAAWSCAMRERFGKRLLRCKGLIPLRTEAGEEPWVIQGVQGYFAKPERLPGWPSAAGEGFVVCIGEAIDAQELEAAMVPLGVVPSEERTTC